MQRISTLVLKEYVFSGPRLAQLYWSFMDRILICGVNWLGDGIMGIPAVSAFKASRPELSISVLVKKSMMPLWQMCDAVDDVIQLESGFSGTIRTAERLNQCGFSQAYIFPNSFRSALLPFMAGIPRRRGVSGHSRKVLLTDIVASDSSGKHQSAEYFDILDIDYDNNVIKLPELMIADDAGEIRKKHLGSFEVGKKIVALLPGAAFGASKMWPEEHFVTVARKLIEKYPCRLLVMGTEAERDICVRISEELGNAAICLAGETTLYESAVLFRDCSFVISNDSGGMHLAAVAGIPVIAVYGLTDPVKTGPLGTGHKLILAEGVAHNRDIERDSEDAINAMRSITPERVYAAAVELLK